MMKKMLLAAAVMTGLAGTAGHAALAHDAPPPPPPGEGCGGHGPHHGHLLSLQGITLTSAQHKKLAALMHGDHPDFRADMQQEHAMRTQLRTLLTTPGAVDQASLTSVEQQLDALHQKRAAQRLQFEVKIHDILTPDQLAQIKDRQDKIDALHEQLHALMAPPAPPQK
ncbi:hypothetical protein CFR72_01095 [Gluconacetobacter entanii]|uniref:LTXXQ motif family protein n=2 Tax=Gluconacetobacter entanii TaxID=108528 RepID=A0A318Q0Z1_9PROT|nr:periplasmic heavy metal sensor [Gluconacetobacter entanii]PYD64422.1 hypothetical protein CFR72_01095 [Gluconacetobacter entanii]